MAGATSEYQVAENVEEHSEQSSPTTSHKLRDWNPSVLFSEMYKVATPKDSLIVKETNGSGKPADFEGFIERLPYGQDKKSTLRTWKQQYFRVRNGILYCFETQKSTVPLQMIELRGGLVTATTETQFSLDNQRGEVCQFRAASVGDAAKWMEVLTSHFGVSPSAHVAVQQPTVRAPESVRSLARTGCPTIVIDLGTSSVRAGLLGPTRSLPALPTYFAPASVAIATGGEVVAVGTAAYDAPTRHKCTVRPLLSTQVLSGGVVQNRSLFFALFQNVFRELSVEQSQLGSSTVLLCLPQHCMTAQATRQQLVDLLFTQFGVGGVVLVTQSYCALLAYKALERAGQTGMSVSIGATLEITTIIEGSVFTGASLYRSMVLGGDRLIDQFRRILQKQGHRFLTDVETWVVRYILEKASLVRTDLNKPAAASKEGHENNGTKTSITNLDSNTEKIRQSRSSLGSRTLDLSTLADLPAELEWSGSQTTGRHKGSARSSVGDDTTDGSLVIDLAHLRMPTFASPSKARVRLSYDARTQASEGFFDSNLWDADCASLPRAIYNQVQQCPIDVRRTILRNVYLSGGLARIPGFADRLTAEIRRQIPARGLAVDVEVHTLPSISYHAAFLGAQALVRANSDEFYTSYRITRDQWTATKSVADQVLLVRRFV